MRCKQLNFAFPVMIQPQAIFPGKPSPTNLASQLSFVLSVIVWGCVVFNPTSLFAQEVPRSSTDSEDDAELVCQPVWAEQSTLQFDGDFAILLTHFTTRLDKFKATRPALCTITQAAKQFDWPLIYLHEGLASNEQYFYCDCSPAAYVDSSLGRFDFDTRDLRHVVIAGGFYELCMDNTFRQVVENWSSLQTSDELRITFLMDGIYGVASDSQSEDSFDAPLHHWIRQQPDATVVMHSAMKWISNRDDAWKFLSRRWSKVPAGMGLHVRYKNEITAVRFAAEGRPTIVLHYTTARDFARSVDEATKRPLPVAFAIHTEATSTE